MIRSYIVPLNITEAKQALTEAINKSPSVEDAFLSIISDSAVIQTGQDISKIAKAALLIYHSDKKGNQDSDELTKKLTSIMSETQNKTLLQAQDIVHKQFKQSPTPKAPPTDSTPFFDANCKKMMKLLKCIEIGDKLNLPSKRAVQFLNEKMDSQEINTQDLAKDIKKHVIEVQKAIKTQLGTDLATLPQTNLTRSLQNMLTSLDINKMAKTEDIRDLYDNVQDIKNMERIFDDITNDKGILPAAKSIVQGFRDEWHRGTRVMTPTDALELKEQLIPNQVRPRFAQGSNKENEPHNNTKFSNR